MILVLLSNSKMETNSNRSWLRNTNGKWFCIEYREAPKSRQECLASAKWLRNKVFSMCWNRTWANPIGSRCAPLWRTLESGKPRMRFRRSWLRIRKHMLSNSSRVCSGDGLTPCSSKSNRSMKPTTDSSNSYRSCMRSNRNNSFRFNCTRNFTSALLRILRKSPIRDHLRLQARRFFFSS